MHTLTKKFTIFLLASISATHIMWIEPLHAELLWDNWYVVSSDGAPESYYNEQAEITGDKAKIRVNTWLKEGTKIKSENLGATAKNTTLLEPLLFNFRTQEMGIEKTIDGTIMNNGKVFSVKIKKGEKTLTPLRAEMLPKLILVSFFPIWVHKNYKKISSVGPKDFHAIVEDQVGDQVPVVKGNVYEMMPDAISKETKTRKLRVVFNNVVAYWYVTPKGDPLQINVPSLKKIVKKTSRQEAEKFL
jgi:hypothetical protein